MRVRKIRAYDALYNAEQLSAGVTHAVWRGGGAEALGLRGPVRRPELLRVWNGRDPWSGDIAVRRGPGGEHTAAFDIIAAAPHALCALWVEETPALREAIEGIHARAVSTTLNQVEKVVPLLRRRAGGAVVREPAAGLVVASFRHGAADTTVGGVPAFEGGIPPLHDHVVVANMALQSHESGRWSGVDGWELHRTSAEMAAVYHAELVSSLRDLGYVVQHSGGRLQTGGVASPLRTAAGTTRAEQTALAARRWTAAAVQRNPIARGHSDPHVQLVARQIAEDMSGADGPASLTRASAAVSGGTLRRRVALAAVGAVPGTHVAPVIEGVQASPLLSRVDADRWTTPAMLQKEAGVIAAARGLAARPPAEVSAAVVATTVHEARVPLSDEQRAAVLSLARARIGLLAAPAGTGKGEVLRVVADARHRAGHRVFAVAAAGETAQRLGEQTAADRSLTLEQFVQRVRGRLQLMPSDLVIVDEASLLETRRWWALLGAAMPASVVAAGDAAQLSPIEAGGMWPLLTRELGAVCLSENFRAREAWDRDAWDALRAGHGVDALQEFDRRGLLVVEDTRAAALRTAVDRWNVDRRALGDAAAVRESLLLADSSNADVDRLNALAQERRLATRDIGGPGLLVETTQRGGLQRQEVLRGGDSVVLTRQVRRPGRAPRLENGTIGEVFDYDPAVPAVDVRIGGRVERLAGNDVTSVRLGYARHVYSAQGRTVDRVYAVIGGWQTRRESSYVAVSRARDTSLIVTDYATLGVAPGDRDAALRELGRRAALSGSKRAAGDHPAGLTDVVPLHPRSPGHRHPWQLDDRRRARPFEPDHGSRDAAVQEACRRQARGDRDVIERS